MPAYKSVLCARASSREFRCTTSLANGSVMIIPELFGNTYAGADLSMKTGE